MFENKKIAVVGCGRWGQNLVHDFHALKVLASISDVDVQRCHALAQRYGVEVLSFQDILETPQIKGVALCVPAVHHVEMGVLALKAGKHVFVEKPMALSLQEGKYLQEISKISGKRLMVGHLLRYHGAFQKLLECVRNGKIGKIRFIDSYRQTPGRICFSDKNVWWSLAPHDISMILALVGTKQPVEIQYAGSPVLSSVDDQGTVSLSFSQEIKARISVSWIHPIKEQRLLVIGTEGILVFNDVVSPKLLFYPYVLSQFNPYEMCFDVREPEIIPYDETQPLYKECAHFSQVVYQGISPLTNGEEGIEVLKILQRIDQLRDKSAYHTQEISANSLGL